MTDKGRKNFHVSCSGYDIVSGLKYSDLKNGAQCSDELCQKQIQILTHCQPSQQLEENLATQVKLKTLIKKMSDKIKMLF